MNIILPTIAFEQLAHVGDMNISRKNSYSYEGNCLSVSNMPVSWAKIAKLGESGYIIKGIATFIDAYSITPEERFSIVQWGLQSGYIEEKTIFRANIYDCELEEWCASDFYTESEAELEADICEETDNFIEQLTAHIATPSLISAVGYASGKMVDSMLSFDFLLIAAAASQAHIDGVWWSDRHDPERLSAPRGGILPQRMANFTFKSANWDDLCALQNSYGRRNLKPKKSRSGFTLQTDTNELKI